MPDLTHHSNASVLVLGTADWSQAIATNQHYMTRELAREYDVIFVESIGLRRPEFHPRDVARMWRRLTRRGARTGQQRPIPHHVDVVAPLVVPIHEGPIRAINRRLLHRQLREWTRHPGPKVLWCYSPVTYGLEHYADVVMYHCVDLLGEVSGISTRMIDAAETALAHAGAVAAGSSETVEHHLRERGFDEVLSWPNVADVDIFLDAERGSTIGRSPRAVFAGNLTAGKVDFSLLGAIVDAGIPLDLAGPVSEGGGNAQEHLDELVSKGATYHGMLNLEQLADLYATCAVGLIPYSLNEYTRGVSPLKTFEYLASGLSVVSTPIPAVFAIADMVEVLPEPNEFVSAVRKHLFTADAPAIASRQVLAQNHGWVQRGKSAREWLGSRLSEGLGSHV